MTDQQAKELRIAVGELKASVRKLTEAICEDKEDLRDMKERIGILEGLLERGEQPKFIPISGGMPMCERKIGVPSRPEMYDILKRRSQQLQGGAIPSEEVTPY